MFTTVDALAWVRRWKFAGRREGTEARSSRCVKRNGIGLWAAVACVSDALVSFIGVAEAVWCTARSATCGGLVTRKTSPAFVAHTVKARADTVWAAVQAFASIGAGLSIATATVAGSGVQIDAWNSKINPIH